MLFRTKVVLTLTHAGWQDFLTFHKVDGSLVEATVGITEPPRHKTAAGVGALILLIGVTDIQAINSVGLPSDVVTGKRRITFDGLA
ncbi:hypothetical protein D9M71_728930 [compost metagenome]